MLLVYTDTITDRLAYVCHFILKEQLGLTYSLTCNLEDCSNSSNQIINYSTKSFSGKNIVNIVPHQLLFEKNINFQHVECTEENGMPYFFGISNSGIPFDIFAATFYLLTRYEEYLPHEKDVYGRFAHENSLAFKHAFLHKPLINIWVSYFSSQLNDKFPEITFLKPNFTFIATYDIDMAWSYKDKGLLRNIGGFMIRPSIERIKVLFGIKKDPFDSFEFIKSLHQKTKIEALFFFLVGSTRSKYDKNISTTKKSMRSLIRDTLKDFTIGLHPSWISNKNISIVKDEKQTLEQITGKSIENSRQHYIEFTLPETFQNLISVGIKNDFSMGYGSINGFRASVASSFLWYDLTNEKTTDLRLFPFCYMDANSHYEQKKNIEESYSELIYYKEECKKVNALFISIFHNNFLGNDKQFKGWREMYDQFIMS